MSTHQTKDGIKIIHGNGRPLIWIGAAIAVCVSITVFFYFENRSWALMEHTAIEEKAILRVNAVDEKIQSIHKILDVIRDDIKIIKEKIR